jgi:hypothetical protein
MSQSVFAQAFNLASPDSSEVLHQGTSLSECLDFGLHAYWLSPLLPTSTSLPFPFIPPPGPPPSLSIIMDGNQGCVKSSSPLPTNCWVLGSDLRKTGIRILHMWRYLEVIMVPWALQKHFACFLRERLPPPDTQQKQNDRSFKAKDTQRASAD